MSPVSGQSPETTLWCLNKGLCFLPLCVWAAPSSFCFRKERTPTGKQVCQGLILETVSTLSFLCYPSPFKILSLSGLGKGKTDGGLVLNFPFTCLLVSGHWDSALLLYALNQLHCGIQHKALKESRGLWWLSSAACHDERLMVSAPSALTLPKTMWQSTLCHYCFQEQLLLSPNCLHQLVPGRVFYIFILWDLPL